MNDKILAAIEESLPQMQVQAIRKALNELTEIRDKLKDSDIEVRRLRRELMDMQTAYSKVDTERDKLTARNAELETANAALTVKDLNNQVAVIAARLEGVEQCTDKFLKNTIYRESLQHQAVDETPNMTYTYTNGVNVPSQNGVNKVSRQVTDVQTKESE